MSVYASQEEREYERRRRGAAVVPIPGWCCWAAGAGVLIALLWSGVLTGLVIWALNRDTCSCNFDILSQSDEQTPAMCTESVDGGTIGITNTTGLDGEDCDSALLVATLHVLPPGVSSATTQQVCACVGDTSTTTVQYSVALYADDGFGQPQGLLISSTPATLLNGTCNCASLTIQLFAGQRFWIAFMSNGEVCGPVDSLYALTYPTIRSGIVETTWPTWPLTMPDLELYSAVTSLYVTYATDCGGPVAYAPQTAE